jgi:SAM-dependent methyltransferase
MDRTAESQRFLAEQPIHSDWETDYLNSDLDPFYDAAFERIVRSLKAKPGETILDAGCGYCFHAARLALAGLKVTGVDLSPAALANARRLLQEQGLSVDLRTGDLLALPFADASFDYVSCWGVLMHVPELERALSELARVLRPGGRLCLMENNDKSVHVRFLEPLIRASKRMLRRPVPRRDRNERGIEEWRTEGLLVRKLNIDWAVAFLARHQLEMVDRFPGQFTEIYTSLPSRSVRQTIHSLNRWWLQANSSSRMALGNILIFEKASLLTERLP